MSLSPELFLEVDPSSRRVVTRPMKGTRAAAAGAAALEASAKDAAELNMIIDLMRNDLGRVCEYGSVRVDEARAIERHGQSAGASGNHEAVWQGVGTVSGRLRAGVGLVELIRAAFPPGSVTGAPKVRAMQIIDELEPVRRGPYCGAIGYVSDSGHAALSVAIRTALVSGVPGRAGEREGGRDEIRDGVLHYSVGAGIVADSSAREEWRETIVKAGVMSSVASIAEEA